MNLALLAQIAAAPSSRVGPKTSTTEFDLAGASWTGVDVDPYDLALKAGLDIDTYSLARCLASEYGSHQPQYLLAAAECVRNSARKSYGAGLGAILNRLTREKKDTRQRANHRYGEQHGRFASTRTDPTERSVVAAKIALREGTEIANGATSWFEPAVQDQGSQGKRKLNYDAAGIVEKWGKDGMQWVGPNSYLNPYVFMGFRHVGVSNVDLKPALNAIEAGRLGSRVQGSPGPAPAAPRPRLIAPAPAWGRGSEPK